MATDILKKTTRIHAPREKVFAYISDPAHVPEWMPNLVEVQNVAGTPAAGTTWNYHYAFAGMHHKGTAHITDYEQNNHVSVKTEGDLLSDWTFRFEQDGEYTRLQIEADYEVPQTLLGRIEAPVLHLLHDNAAEHAIQNLKAHLE